MMRRKEAMGLSNWSFWRTTLAESLRGG